MVGMQQKNRLVASGPDPLLNGITERHCFHLSTTTGVGPRGLFLRSEHGPGKKWQNSWASTSSAFQPRNGGPNVGEIEFRTPYEQSRAAIVGEPDKRLQRASRRKTITPHKPGIMVRVFLYVGAAERSQKLTSISDSKGRVLDRREKLLAGIPIPCHARNA